MVLLEMSWVDENGPVVHYDYSTAAHAGAFWLANIGLQAKRCEHFTIANRCRRPAGHDGKHFMTEADYEPDLRI